MKESGMALTWLTFVCKTSSRVQANNFSSNLEFVKKLFEAFQYYKKKEGISNVTNVSNIK